jgi:hypothetical protein
MPVMFCVPRSLWLGVLLAGSAAAWGENPILPQGGEFSIMGGVSGDQVLPSVALSPSAGYIVWQDNVVDKHGAGVGGAQLDTAFAAGRTHGVNKTLTGDQINPKVALLANGKTIVVWQSAAAGTPDIYARLARNNKNLDAYGTNFFTLDIRLNSYVTDQQTSPVVAALPDGSAVVAWQSYGQDGSLWGVYARRILAGGRIPVKEFRVNQYTSYNQRAPAVATLAGGNYVIVWVSEQERFYNSCDVYARIFTPAGVAVSDEIAVNSGTNPCDTPAVAPLNDGGFTVVWSQKDLAVPTNNWDVWGRPFSAGGQPEVADFRVNSFLFGDQYKPQIAAGPSGSLVVWTSMGQDGSREGVFGRFLAGGTQIGGDEFRVNSTTISQQMHPAVAWNGLDHFLVVWASFQSPGTGFDLYGQAYFLNSSP